VADGLPADLDKKKAIMQEFRRRRAAGEPVSAELYNSHIWATNDGYASGPDPGQPIPDFSLRDQAGDSRSLADLAGPQGLFLVFHRSADW
jgi:hypothetical protein